MPCRILLESRTEVVATNRKHISADIYELPRIREATMSMFLVSMEDWL
jgi:hypothetical protein